MSDHHTPTSPQQQIVMSDDPIRKFQGRMVSVNGWQLPFAVRYVSWGLFLFLLPLVMIGDRLLTGSISPIPLVDLLIAGILSNRIANATTGEVSLPALITYSTRKIRAAANTRRHTRTTTSVDRVNARRRHHMVSRTYHRTAREER